MVSSREGRAADGLDWDGCGIGKALDGKIGVACLLASISAILLMAFVLWTVSYVSLLTSDRLRGWM